MIRIKGDITKTEYKIIAHGVNTLGVMGAGVAKAIAMKWPKVEKEYQEWIAREAPTEKWRKLILGKVCFSWVEDHKKLICNIFTQTNVGRDGRKYASYTAITEGLTKVAEYCHRAAPNSKIAIPEIGCGYGGLKWELVSELLKELEDRYDVEFVVYEL